MTELTAGLFLHFTMSMNELFTSGGKAQPKKGHA